MKNLIIRSLSGLILVAAFVAMIFVSKFTFLLLILFVTVGSMAEFFKLISKTGISPQRTISIVCGAIMVATNFFVALGIIDVKYFVINILPFAIIISVELYRKKENPFTNIAYSILGIMYIAIPMSVMCYIPVVRVDGVAQYAPMMIFTYMLLVWANDVGAYLVGVTMGKNKLFERISPKKSWEGFWGGIIFAIATGWVMSNFEPIIGKYWVLFSIIIAVSSVFGDLAESMLKRSVNIKDSGSIIPGHGGFLDRFDAMFVSAPILFVFLILFM